MFVLYLPTSMRENFLAALVSLKNLLDSGKVEDTVSSCLITCTCYQNAINKSSIRFEPF